MATATSKGTLRANGDAIGSLGRKSLHASGCYERQWFQTFRGLFSVNIVADENLALLDELFGEIGNIRKLPGRRITSGDLEEADILLVRSVTRVDRSLLEGSPVCGALAVSLLNHSSLLRYQPRFVPGPLKGLSWDVAGGL